MQTKVMRIAGKDVTVVLCQIKGGYGCKHKTCHSESTKRVDGFQRAGSGVFACIVCGKSTRNTNATGNTQLCGDCFDDAGMENEHSDGHHEGQTVTGCRDCTGG